jgi:predicted HD phosphohydrolase
MNDASSAGIDSVDATVHEIVETCTSMVGLPYDGEPVDQLEHALQCALLAREGGGDREFVVAALLHDIARAPAVAGIPSDGPAGRLPPGAAVARPDAEPAVVGEHHGETAARWLTPRVGERVAWLAEQHVAAKRYLVATDPGYREKLTEVSARTLIAQGGPMSENEVCEFRANPDWQLALRLREIDDQGKVPGAEVPGIETYRDDLTVLVSACRG